MGVPIADDWNADPAASLRATFPRVDLADLLRADRPPRDWIIDGLIPAASSTSFVAAAGSGKSLLTLAIGAAVAKGHRSFAGLPIRTRRRVLLIDAENSPDDLAERLTDLGYGPDDAAALEPLVLLHMPPLTPLDTAQGGRELLALCEAYGIGAGDMVALDSLQRVTSMPENDSDSLRAFERHTSQLLRRAGIAVVRTDNTGRDVSKGARGTSGKKDDVTLEWLIRRDNSRLYLNTGKLRLRDVHDIVVDMSSSPDGRIVYTTGSDPHRVAVDRAIRDLDDLGVDSDASQRTATAALKAAHLDHTRAVIRAAVSERQHRLQPTLTAPSEGAPNPRGAPDTDDHADGARRTTAHPTNGAPGSPESRAETRADDSRRSPGAVSASAAPCAPPPWEGARGAHTGEDHS